MGKTKYSIEILEPLVKKSKSYAQVLNFLGLSVGGGSQSYIKNKISEFNIDVSHFKGQGWKRGVFSLGKKLPNEYLIESDKRISISTYQIKNWKFRDKIKEKDVKSVDCMRGKVVPFLWNFTT